LQITALGHSCIILDFQDDETREHTRILIDPWLSDHATGDGMGRFPRLRFDAHVLGTIDAVFLSHAHSDHLDPYTLVRLWRELESPPVLLLPITLAFLVPVFQEFLPDCEIGLLHAHTPVDFKGVELFGFFDVGMAPTNEEDVMVLVVRNGAEIALVEADANLALEHPEFREFISALLAAPDIESAVFLTTENELTGTLGSKDCASSEDRDELADMAMNEMIASVQALYEPSEDPSDLWNSGRLLRLIHGQGLAAPSELDPQWQHILFPVRIAHRVQQERATAQRVGLRHRIDSLTVGGVHTITDGHIEAIEPLPGLTQLDHDDSRTFDRHSTFFPTVPLAPLRLDERDVQTQRARIQALLNDRFLPYLHGMRQPPVLHLLAGYGGTYRVRIHYGSTPQRGALDYVLGFEHPHFLEEEPDGMAPAETYWANDLDDFLDGRCDEFSTFCRTQFPNQEMRLWACLATPLLNSDLVIQRVRHHFQRAQDGLTPGSFVMPLFGQHADSSG